MARVSLILPAGSLADAPDDLRLEPFRAALESAGHEAELIVAVTGAESAAATNGGPRVVAVGGRPGRAAAAVGGLAAAGGQVRVVLDPAMGYTPDDLAALVEPLADGRADLAIARRPGRSAPRALAGRMGRPFLGTSDPLSGLVGLTESAFLAAEPVLDPVGSRFAVELLAKVRGRRVEVLTGPVARSGRPRAGLDDLRHAKRLADRRFGNLSRLFQFCVVGASGMVVDLTTYALLQAAFGRIWPEPAPTPLIGGPLSLTVAALGAIALALTWNFALNRRLTFNDSRDGSIVRQYFVYALSNALGISVSLVLRLLLPLNVPFFRSHKLAAAVVGIVAATGISFSMSRYVVFGRAKPPAGPPAEPLPDLEPAVEPSRAG